MTQIEISDRKRMLIFVNIVISCIASSMLATALTTALLTSLRTIAGAIGTAVFVAIMTVVSDSSVEKYGENASMHGVNVAFFAMAAASIVMVIIAVAGTRSSRQRVIDDIMED